MQIEVKTGDTHYRVPLYFMTSLRILLTKM